MSSLSRGLLAEAEADARAAMAAHADAAPAGEPYRTAWACWALALGRLGQHAAAAREYASLIEKALPAVGEAGVLGWRISHVGQRAYLGQHDAAEAACRMAIERAWDIRPAPLGKGFRLLAVSHLILTMNVRGQPEQAESLARSAEREAAMSANLPRRVLLLLRSGLASSLNAQARYQEAEQALHALQPGHPMDAACVRLNLAAAWIGLGRPAEAEAGIRESITGELGPSPAHYLALAAGTLLGSALARQGRVDEARGQLQASAAAWAANFGDGHPKAIAAHEELARLIRDAGQGS
jgi:hypothetical protein